MMKSIYHCILHSNSLSNEMDKSLLDVRGLPISIVYCSSDELGVPIILIDTEQMFALQRDAWYNINVNIVYYLRKKNYFRR